MSALTLTTRAPREAIVITPRSRRCSVRRYYDPTTGQFTSVDPAVDQTEAPYAYAAGDPVDSSDPSGLCNWNPISTSFWTDGNCISDNVDYVPVLGSVKSAVTCQAAGYSAYDCVAASFDPAYLAVQGYDAEAQAYENGCSPWTVARDGALGTLGLAATGAAVFGGAADGLGAGNLWARLADETGAIGKYGNLGNLASRADEKLADVIRSRGGGASQVRQLQTGYGELTLGELSDLAAAGDRDAIAAIKMAKQAGSQGKGGK
jgi:hypothetical protein